MSERRQIRQREERGVEGRPAKIPARLQYGIMLDQRGNDFPVTTAVGPFGIEYVNPAEDPRKSSSQQPRAAGRQRDWVHDFRIRRDRKMAGAA